MNRSFLAEKTVLVRSDGLTRAAASFPGNPSDVPFLPVWPGAWSRAEGGALPRLGGGAAGLAVPARARSCPVARDTLQGSNRFEVGRLSGIL